MDENDIPNIININAFNFKGFKFFYIINVERNRH